MDLLLSEHQKIKMRASEYEHALQSSEAERLYALLPSPFMICTHALVSQNRRHIQILEAKVRSLERRQAPPTSGVAQMIATQALELDTVRKRNGVLQEENEGLMDENDRLRVELEALKASAASAAQTEEAASEDEGET